MSVSISSTVYGLTDVGVILASLRRSLILVDAQVIACAWPSNKAEFLKEKACILRLIDDMERAQRFECSLTLVQRASTTK